MARKRKEKTLFISKNAHENETLHHFKQRIKEKYDRNVSSHWVDRIKSWRVYNEPSAPKRIQ